MKRLLPFLVLLVSVSACSGDRVRSTEHPWVFRTFPIGGWCPPSPIPEQVKLYKEAHFTLMIAGSEKEVQLAREQDLAVLLYNPNMAHQPFTDVALNEVSSLAKRHKNIVGFQVWDEPSPDRFPDIARWTRELHRAHPNHLAWINLHPVKIVEEELPGVTIYAPYLDDFISKTGPDVLSYDNYGSLRESNDDIFFYKDFEESYVFYNMGFFRDRSLQHGIPFWGFAISSPHWTYFTPSEADLRFQVYSLLTYGAKGLWYFTYNTAEGLSGHNKKLSKEIDIDIGLVRPDGTLTDRYDMVKRINGEVLALGPTLLGLTSTGVYHLDAPKRPRTYYLEDPKDVPELKRDPLPAGGFLKSVTGGRPLVGLFQDRSGGDYFMVMNKKRRVMDVVTRIALGEDRHREELKPGRTLGQKFHADRPISAVSLLASSYSGVGHVATMRLKQNGPEGKVVATWAWYNLFANNAVIMRFPAQPPGDYYFELSEVRGRIGWWSQENAQGQGGAYTDGKPVSGVDRNFIAYSEPDLSSDRMVLTFSPAVTGLEEVSKKDGRLIRHSLKNGTIVVDVAQGDGLLFRVIRSD